MTLPPPQIIVVGAGVVGASVAWHLALGGARVLVVEKNAGPAQGVTEQAFGWVGSAAHGPGDDPELFQFRMRALADHERVRAALGDTVPQSSKGALVWGEDAAETEALIHWHTENGSSLIAKTGHDLAEMEPALTAPPPLAAYSGADFATEPAALAQAMLDAAQGLGTRVLCKTDVRRLEPGAIVLGNGHTIHAPLIVLACGTGVAPLAAQLDVRLNIKTSAAVLMTGTAPSGLASHILCGPEFEIRQRPDGRVFLADDTPQNGAEGLDDLRRRSQQVLRRHFRTGHSAHLMDIASGVRPLTTDGWPMVGRLPGSPGIYLAVGHPGVILAPFIGRIAAEEILRDRRDPEADKCAPRRFIR